LTRRKTSAGFGWREWGRIGSPGTVQARTFEREDDARRAEARGIRRRERRGYHPTQDVVSRWREVISAGVNIATASDRAKTKLKNREYSANDNQGRFDF
jgi:predicted DNA-binding WGR domain protein